MSFSESYLHKYAKIVLSSWLRKRMRIGNKFEGMKNITLDLTFPKQAPLFDVYMEYPVCYDKKTKQMVGLTGLNDKYDNCWKEWFNCNPEIGKPSSKTFIPTYYELQKVKDRLLIKYIFDVVVIDEGKLNCVFEIQHTNPINRNKEKFLIKHSIKTYELSAKWIMENTKLPFEFEILKKINID